MREILDELLESRASGRKAVYCSVIETRGSTPQKPGATMLVFEDGSQAGTLGGGCTEAEVRRQSLLLMDKTEPSLLQYTLDDDYGWDDGLICGGRMTFLAQPVSSEESWSYLGQLRSLVEAGTGGTEVISFEETKSRTAMGTRLLFDARGSLIARLGAMPFDGGITPVPKSLSSRPKPHAEGGWAYIPMLPRCRVFIIGAGHVGRAVAELAQKVDFDVWVLDDREAYANRDRFPMARRIWVEDIGRALSQYQPDENTYCLIMTRGHSHDEEALYHLVGKPARYLGLIGSRRKIRMIFEDLLKEGITDEALAQVHAPLGFDIGSQTVPEIALSMVSYLVGHRNRGITAFPPNGSEILDSIRSLSKANP